MRRTEEVKRLSLIERRLTLAFGDRFKLSAPVSESGDKYQISVSLGRQERLQTENTTRSTRPRLIY